MGCKVFGGKSGGVSDMRFTLTMWDVKITDAFIQDSRSEFYLNYVGCKVSYIIKSILKRFSFTLTMWDVKAKKEIKNGIDFVSFTLTMWDVKQFME